MLEDEYQAAIVIDELNDFNWDPIDPDEPFEGLARRSIAIPFNGTMETRVAHLQKLAGITRSTAPSTRATGAAARGPAPGA
jgi:hypothetical protein